MEGVNAVVLSFGLGLGLGLFAEFGLVVGYVLCEVVDAHFSGCVVEEGSWGGGVEARVVEVEFVRIDERST